MDTTEHLQLNETAIIERVLGGDTQAYGMIVKRYWKMALAIAYAKCRNSATAEDIAQDSFLKAYCHLSTLRDRSRFAGWLTKIIHQECISYHRSQKASYPIDSRNMDHFEPVFAAKSNPGLSSEQMDFVHRAIKKLPSHMQEIIIMRFVGGLPLKQIAEQIETKYGTVRVWLHRAYKLLKEELAPILEEVQS
ncbi:MAG: RNA polymerase sigma factor [Planctomycetota bacterium]|jgi:RNA polymerase sigma-70 factor (ECF subfamily)